MPKLMKKIEPNLLEWHWAMFGSARNIALCERNRARIYRNNHRPYSDIKESARWWAERARFHYDMIRRAT